MEYAWKVGKAGGGVAAQVVGDRVEALAGDGDVCHPSDLVDDARPAKSPLHGMFEWNDSAAADEHRKYQARGIINSVRVVVEGAERIDYPPAFVHVEIERGTNGDTEQRPGYMTTVRALDDEEYRRQVTMDALATLDAFERRYKSLIAFAPVFKAVKRARKKIMAG